jgi:hypothetical protein
MKRAQLLVTLVCALLLPATAFADDPPSPYDPYGLEPGSYASHLSTWGTSHAVHDATSVSRDAPVTHARQLVTLARSLDDAANVDEKAATELTAKLPSMRAAAKTARERADRASVEDKEALGARADDLETDVVVSEAEITFKRTTAADNRRVARGLRRRAVKLVRETPPTEEPTATCEPPFRYTPDGRKIYRIECLK